MVKERLSTSEISKARGLIEKLPETKRADYYLLLQGKVNYKNQRNNEAAATDLDGNPWMKKYNVTTVGDIIVTLLV